MEAKRTPLRRTLNPRTKVMTISLTPEVYSEVAKAAKEDNLAPTTMAALLVARAVDGEYERIRRRRRRAERAAERAAGADG